MQRRIDQEPLTAQLWRRRAWLAPGLLVALIAVVVTNFRIQLLPPALERDSAEFAAARTEVLVDFRGRSVLADLNLYTGFLSRAREFLCAGRSESGDPRADRQRSWAEPLGDRCHGAV